MRNVLIAEISHAATSDELARLVSVNAEVAVADARRALVARIRVAPSIYVPDDETIQPNQ